MTSEDYVEAVLAVVETVPPGRAVTYGDVAEVVREELGTGGPRTVGQVMLTYGAEVCWWRVVRADGRLAAPLRDRARPAYLEEGTPLLEGAADHDRRGDLRVDLEACRWPLPHA